MYEYTFPLMGGERLKTERKGLLLLLRAQHIDNAVTIMCAHAARLLSSDEKDGRLGRSLRVRGLSYDGRTHFGIKLLE